MEGLDGVFAGAVIWEGVRWRFGEGGLDGGEAMLEEGLAGESCYFWISCWPKGFFEITRKNSCSDLVLVTIPDFETCVDGGAECES